MKADSSLHRRLVAATEALYHVCNALCNALLSTQIVAISIVVIGRFAFRRSPGWGEELSLLCMVWFTMLSVSIGFRNENHIRMTVLDRLLPRKWLAGISVFNDLVVLAFAFILIRHGIDVVLLNINRMSTALRISVGILYASVPVGGVFLIAMLTLKSACRLFEGRGLQEAHDA